MWKWYALDAASSWRHILPITQQKNVRGAVYCKNYEFEFQFNPPWGLCRVVMTCVTGHIMGQDFEGRYRSWNGCNPIDLFEATIGKQVDPVSPPGLY